ncbi:MAG: glycoside hydrolase family 172 protein [Rhodothermales bacterium]
MLIDLSNIFMKRNAVSRSISAENPDGAPGGGGRATAETTLHPPSANNARELGPGWKLSPCIAIEAGETAVLMDHEGPGCIRHIWMTLDSKCHRDVVLRVYWDGSDRPSIETPIGDFFCNSWNTRQKIAAIPINVNPSGGMNCYFPMPFRRNAKITVENQAPQLLNHLFYQIDYTLEPVPADALYLHAQWRRENPVRYGVPYTLLDGVEGAGQFVGTFVSWQQNTEGWWGEGEIKMFIDDDRAYPTICGTGTEDYFGGAWCFGEDYSAPYLGYQKVSGDGVGSRLTMYRFHVLDPVFFSKRLKVTLQALGWRSRTRYLPLQDDVASVSYWYQTLPTSAFPALPEVNEREVI